jgi:hypothetical protein
MTNTTSEMALLAKYKASLSTGESIHIANSHLPAQSTRMIVWMLNHP